MGRVEVNAVPETGRGGLDTRLTDGGAVVSFTRGPRSTPQKHRFPASDTHFCENLSQSQGLVRPEGLDDLKKTHSPHRVSNHEININNCGQSFAKMSTP
jgi:hypothetical protein